MYCPPKALCRSQGDEPEGYQTTRGQALARVGQAAVDRRHQLLPMSEEESKGMPSGAILKEEGTVPPMPLDAFVKEEVVITKEEEEADVPEPDDPTEEEEAGNRLQQQLDEDKVQVPTDFDRHSADQHSADQQEALRVASLSNEELSFEAAQRLGGSVAEQLEILQTIQACSAEGPAHSLDAAVALLADQQEAFRVASLSNEERNFEAAQNLGSPVAEQQKLLDMIARPKAAAQLRQIVDAFDRGTEAVAALLQAGVDINAVGHEGRDGHGVGNTALHVAAMRGLTALVKLLLKHGADASVKNGTNKTAADLASKTKSERGRGQYDRPRAGCAGCLALLEAHAKAHAKAHGASEASMLTSVAPSGAGGGDAAGSSAASGASSGSSKRPTAAKSRRASRRATRRSPTSGCASTCSARPRSLMPPPRSSPATRPSRCASTVSECGSNPASSYTRVYMACTCRNPVPAPPCQTSASRGWLATRLRMRRSWQPGGRVCRSWRSCRR